MSTMTPAERDELLNGDKRDGETERDRIARVAEEIAVARLDEVARLIRASREAAWHKFLNGPGGTTEALRQGKVDGMDLALRKVRFVRDGGAQ